MSEIAGQEACTAGMPAETMNQLTHGAGLALSLAGGVHLLRQLSVDGYLAAGCWVYVIALVALFAASTLSHSYTSGPRRTRYRTLDQLAIFAVMAATYTPISLAACGDGWWNLPLVVMWLMAGLGAYLKLRVTREEMVPVWFYVLLGWVPLLAFPRILSHLGMDGTAWVAAGGACYLLGVIFLTNDHRARYFHAVWHVLVIMGSACHYVVICDYAMRTA